MRPTEGVNNAYHSVFFIHFKEPGNTVVVTAHVPEEDISIDFGPTWNQSGVGKAIESMTNTLNQVGSAVAGTQLKSPLTSALVYGGTENPTMAFTIELNAESSAYDEVLRPVADLLAMCVPEVKSAVTISAPGPTLADAVAGFANTVGSESNNGIKLAGERIMVQVGNAVIWDNVVITSMSIKLGTKFAPDGLPLRATISIQVKNFMTPYRNDVYRALGVN